MNNRKRIKNEVNFISTIVFITNMSQLPIFVEKGITQLLTYICWGGLLFSLIIKRNIILTKKTLKILLISILIFILFSFQSLFTQNDYFGTRIFYSLFLSLFIFFMSSFLPNQVIEKNNINLILKSYIVSATIVAINIYIEYFSKGFDIMERTYAYGSKNSISQIIITAIVLSLFLNFKSRFKNILKYLIMIFLIIILLLLKSRANIIGLVILLGGLLVSDKINLKFKISILIFTIIGTICVVINESLYDIVINGILAGGREITNLNDISSGRFEEWLRAPQIIEENLLFGRGRYKFESFFLSVLAQLGIITGGLIIALAIYPFFFSLKYRKIDKIYSILSIISLIYLINGLFEELSPFGPGVKCYFMWFLFGLLINKIHTKGEV